jgi:peptide alpha-N-acetyltransferase
MLATAEAQRGRGVATRLVRLTLDAMVARGAVEVVLESEVVNEGARRLYERLGFVRSKRLARYYMNGSEAFRLVLGLGDDGREVLGCGGWSK